METFAPQRDGDWIYPPAWNNQNKLIVQNKLNIWNESSQLTGCQARRHNSPWDYGNKWTHTYPVTSLRVSKPWRNLSQVESGKFLEWRRQNWKSRETKMARTLRLECQGRQSCTEAEPRNEQSPPQASSRESTSTYLSENDPRLGKRHLKGERRRPLALTRGCE